MRSWSFSITVGSCFAGAMASLVSGCLDPQGGTDVGNGATVQFDLQAYEQTATASPQGVMLSDGARVDGLWMVMDRIRFQPGTDCSAEDPEVDLQGTLVADLLNGGVYGGPASFSVEPGPFCQLRVGFHRLDVAPPAGAPAELAGLSILMKGARADGTPFTVASALDEELELAAKGGSFTLPAGANPLFLAYELNSWMAALDLASLSGPVIVVSDSANAARLQAFEDAVKMSALLFRDQDGDGSISPAERAPGSELTDAPAAP